MSCKPACVLKGVACELCVRQKWGKKLCTSSLVDFRMITSVYCMLMMPRFLLDLSPPTHHALYLMHTCTISFLHHMVACMTAPLHRALCCNQEHWSILTYLSVKYLAAQIIQPCSLHNLFNTHYLWYAKSKLHCVKIGISTI